jgi:beta-glucosidase
VAEEGRLGIPITISTDPRSHFQYVLGASSAPTGFSQWPDPLGFGALADPALVRRFADIVRREYRAVGIHEALSPQADLATEPRWSRATGTFGSGPARVAPLVQAYVEGFQHGSDGLAPDGVMAVVKHWVGYGAEPDGFDAHNAYGRIARLGPTSFADHVAAFDGALAVKVGGVMPAYTITAGVTVNGHALEPVGAGFSRQLITGLLREAHGFDGVVLSDWGVTNDCSAECLSPTRTQTYHEIAMPWGVETLSQADRFEKGIEAGVDQFGGVDQPGAIVTAVRAGRIDEARIDQSVRRILRVKFQLGLFDDPFVDLDKAGAVTGDPAFQATADDAQRRAQVLLEASPGALPLRSGLRVWIHGLSADVVRAAGFTVVDSLETADVAVIRMATPHEVLHPDHFFGVRQHEGRLDFREGDPDFDALRAASARVPTIVSVYMDRPAILTAVRPLASALLVNFGASDAALFDVLTGRATAQGRLPFELPSSMAAVAAQDPARADDSDAPLYPAGAGIVP